MRSILDWERRQGKAEVPFMPGRVLMQDFTGVPAVVDIASLQSELLRRGAGGDGERGASADGENGGEDGSENGSEGAAGRPPGRPTERPTGLRPQIPVDVVIDHSVQVDRYGTRRALDKNVELEYGRNAERYRLLKWAAGAFDDFSVLPPGMGICHQVNLEFLGKVVAEREGMLFPDTLVGTDSHTPMINGLGVLGWGVGGIEAEAAMLGRPLYFTLPEVVGVEISGSLPAGATTTDLVLAVTELLRRERVVGKFVEFYGEGVANLEVTDRATISNMSPEFGCTVSYFPVDGRTLEYLGNTGRSSALIDTVERYARENLVWNEGGAGGISYSSRIELDLSQIRPSVAGPSRPQDRIELEVLKERIEALLERKDDGEGGKVPAAADGAEAGLEDGSVVISALTSCTNTSNPDVMLAAGLLARNAVRLGLKTPGWVKTSLAPARKR